jgi:hypothetical protein
MRKIKVFSDDSFEHCEEQVNLFIKSCLVNAISATASTCQLHDEYDDGTICNRWQEFMITLLYEEK